MKEWRAKRQAAHWEADMVQHDVEWDGQPAEFAEDPAMEDLVAQALAQAEAEAQAAAVAEAEPLAEADLALAEDAVPEDADLAGDLAEAELATAAAPRAQAEHGHAELDELEEVLGEPVDAKDTRLDNRLLRLRGVVLRMLRHGHFGMNANHMDREGWALVDTVLRKRVCDNASTYDLEQVCAASEQRLEMTQDYKLIRCTRGHTIPGIKGQRTPAMPTQLPPILYHCTTAQAAAQIMGGQGLKLSHRGDLIYMSLAPLQSMKRPVCLVVYVRRLVKMRPETEFWWVSDPSCGIVVTDKTIPASCMEYAD